MVEPGEEKAGGEHLRTISGPVYLRATLGVSDLTHCIMKSLGEL